MAAQHTAIFVHCKKCSAWTSFSKTSLKKTERGRWGWCVRCYELKKALIDYKPERYVPPHRICPWSGKKEYF